MQQTSLSRRRLLASMAALPAFFAFNALFGSRSLAQTTGKATLQVTPTQVDGPYFLPNSPMTKRFIPQGMAGQEIHVSGTVVDVNGAPIPGATVHVWVASPTGVYDNQDAAGRPMRIPLAKQTLRGRVITDAQGGYGFECLRPGNYELGNGMMRPAHIHVMVEARGFQTLITQLYFTDDQFNKKDLPGPGFFTPELLVPLTPAAPLPNQIQTGTYQIVLAR